MGISISFKERKSPFSQFFSSTAKTRETASLLAHARGYKFIDAGEKSFAIEFCPTGALAFNYKDGILAGETQTNPVGPGFHKAVIDFLEAFTFEAKIDLEVVDEAVYQTERNFPNLQQKHLNWLGSVLKIVRSQRSAGPSLHINWPSSSWKPVGWHGIISPQGVYSFDILDQIEESQDLADFARRFTIWIHDQQDAYFHRGAALYLMWHDFAWVPPRTEVEEGLAGQILDHLARARSLNQDIPLPVAEWEELAVLAGHPTDKVSKPGLETAGPIGFRRGKILAPFPGRWVAELPGELIERVREGEKEYWDNDRQFRLTPYFVSPQKFGPGSGVIPDFQFGADPTKLIQLETNGYSYSAKWDLARDGDNSLYRWTLEGVIQGQDKFAIVTIAWNNEKWQPWAVETFLHVQPPSDSLLAADPS